MGGGGGRPRRPPGLRFRARPARRGRARTSPARAGREPPAAAGTPAQDPNHLQPPGAAPARARRTGPSLPSGLGHRTAAVRRRQSSARGAAEKGRGVPALLAGPSGPCAGSPQGKVGLGRSLLPAQHRRGLTELRSASRRGFERAKGAAGPSRAGAVHRTGPDRTAPSPGRRRHRPASRAPDL